MLLVTPSRCYMSNSIAEKLEMMLLVTPLDATCLSSVVPCLLFSPHFFLHHLLRLFDHRSLFRQISFSIIRRCNSEFHLAASVLSVSLQIWREQIFVSFFYFLSSNVLVAGNGVFPAPICFLFPFLRLCHSVEVVRYYDGGSVLIYRRYSPSARESHLLILDVFSFQSD